MVRFLYHIFILACSYRVIAEIKIILTKISDFGKNKISITSKAIFYITPSPDYVTLLYHFDFKIAN